MTLALLKVLQYSRQSQHVVALYAAAVALLAAVWYCSFLASMGRYLWFEIPALENVLLVRR